MSFFLWTSTTFISKTNNDELVISLLKYVLENDIHKTTSKLKNWLICNVYDFFSISNWFLYSFLRISTTFIFKANNEELVIPPSKYVLILLTKEQLNAWNLWKILSQTHMYVKINYHLPIKKQTEVLDLCQTWANCLKFLSCLLWIEDFLSPG